MNLQEYINVFIQNYVILGWFLPCLVMLLFQLRFYQWIDGGSTMKELWDYHNENGWLLKIIIICSVIYPIGIIFYTAVFVWYYYDRKLRKYIPVIKYDYKKVLYDLFMGEIKWRG